MSETKTSALQIASMHSRVVNLLWVNKQPWVNPSAPNPSGKKRDIQSPEIKKLARFGYDKKVVPT
jgi:hypothetical protein